VSFTVPVEECPMCGDIVPCKTAICPFKGRKQYSIASSAQPEAAMGGVDWVECPVCGESDMPKEAGIIKCNNLECASNGGTNTKGKFYRTPATPAPQAQGRSELVNGAIQGFEKCCARGISTELGPDICRALLDYIAQLEADAARRDEALQEVDGILAQIANGGIAGEPRNHEATVGIMRGIAKEAHDIIAALAKGGQ